MFTKTEWIKDLRSHTMDQYLEIKMKQTIVKWNMVGESQNHHAEGEKSIPKEYIFSDSIIWSWSSGKINTWWYKSEKCLPLHIWLD